MSKHNKVNPDHYHQAGRLTPDDLARERAKQQPSQDRRERGKASSDDRWRPPTRGQGARRTRE